MTTRRSTSLVSTLAVLAIAAAPFAGAAEPVRLTLADAVQRATSSAPRVQQLDALATAAAAGRDAATAARRPALDVSAGYTRYSSVDAFTLALPGLGERTIFPDLPNAWRSRAQVSMPLYTGGRQERLVASSERELSAAGADREAGVNDLVLETTGAYWTLVATRAEERVLREALAAYDAHLTDARHRQQFGLAAANEVLTVQVERDQAELARLSAATNGTIAEANLARLVGLPEGTAIEAADVLDAPPSADVPLDDLVARALANRADRRALAERVQAADERARAQASGARPQVAVAAGYDFANPNRRYMPQADEWKGSWDVGVSASWSVLDGGRTRAAVAEARARADAARRGLEDLDRRIRLEVRQRTLEIANARAAVQVAATTIRSAEENRRVSGERYRAGVSLSSELLDAETGLLRAGLSRTEALARLRLAEAALARAVGGR